MSRPEGWRPGDAEIGAGQGAPLEEVVVPPAGVVSDATLAEAVAVAQRALRERGWLVLNAAQGPDRDGYAYTVGMTAAGLPELAVLGLPVRTAQAVLNHLAPLHLAEPGNEGLVPGRVYPGPAGVGGQWEVSVPADLAAVRPVFAMALYARRGRPVRLLEVTWLAWAGAAGAGQ